IVTPSHLSLVLGKIWIGLHFRDLLGVPLAVRRNEQQPFVRIHRLLKWIVGRSMLSQVVCGLQEGDCLGTACLEASKSFSWRRAAFWHQWTRGLSLLAAIRNRGKDQRI